MTFRLSVCLSALALVIGACHELQSPAGPALLVPNTGLNVSGPEVANRVVLAAAPLSTVQLPNYLYPTWVETRIDGYITLTSLPGSSAPAGRVYSSGVMANGDCSMQVSLYFPGAYNFTPNPCGVVQDPRVDTLQAAGAAYAKRGNKPNEYFCGNGVPLDQCHTWSGQQYVSITPLTVTLDSLRPDLRTVPFNAGPARVKFTSYISPAWIRVQGNWIGNPRYNTLWSYIDGDGTAESIPCYTGLNATFDNCWPTIAKAGRMTLKSYVGGWEQTASATVQCLMTPADPTLNDSTSDFRVRSALLAAMDTSNVDSAPGRGYDPLTGHGWKHESGGAIVKMNDSTTKAIFLPSADGIGTECLYSPTLHPALPPGAVRVVSHFHTHPTEYNKPVFGCPDEGNQRFAQSPADTLPSANPQLPYKRSRIGKYGGGSNSDWNTADTVRVPVYVVEKGGKVWRLDPAVDTTQRPNNPESLAGARRKLSVGEMTVEAQP